MSTPPIEPDASAAFYRTLVEQISAVTYVDRFDQGVAVPTYVSPQVRSILGLEPEAWLAESTLWRRFVHPDDRDAAIESFARGLASGVPFSFSYRFVRPDEDVIWIEERATIVGEGSGEGSGFIHGVMVDVTESRIAEDEAKRTASLLAATLESTADGILVVDSDGKISASNARFAAMWGIPDEIVASRDDGAAIAHVLSQLSEPEVFAAKITELYATPEEESFDVLVFKDGRVFERYSVPQRLGDEVVGRVWSFRDVSEQRSVETEYRSLVDRLPAIVYIAVPGIGAPWLYVSARVEEVLGYSPIEWREDPELWYRIIHPDDRDRVMSEEGQSIQPGGILVSEYRMIARDGRTVWIRDEGEFVSAADGQPGVIRGLMYDVTAERLAAQALRREQEMLAGVVDNIPVMLVFFDPDGRVALINRETERVLGWSLEDMQTTDMLSEIYPDPAYRAHVEQAIGEQRRGSLAGQWVEFRARTRDGSIIESAWFDHAFEDGSHLGIGQDITERKRVEEERRHLLAHVVAAQEEERVRIAGDIHDDTIQAMTVVEIRLASLARELADHTASASLADVRASVQSAVARLRHLLFQLRPRTLDEEGLAPTLRILFEQFARDEGFDGHLEDRLVQEPSTPIRAVLYRIVQEALSNVRKHAPGARVVVMLEPQERGFHVRVRDEGPGFDTVEIRESPVGHMGLSSMRERASMAGGWFRIDSAPGKGTTVECWVPEPTENPSS